MNWIAMFLTLFLFVVVVGELFFAIQEKKRSKFTRKGIKYPRWNKWGTKKWRK